MVSILEQKQSMIDPRKQHCLKKAGVAPSIYKLLFHKAFLSRPRLQQSQILSRFHAAFIPCSVLRQVRVLPHLDKLSPPLIKASLQFVHMLQSGSQIHFLFPSIPTYCGNPTFIHSRDYSAHECKVTSRHYWVLLSG